MPRRAPSMTLHKASGQARVRLDGRDVYLGQHGTPQAEAEYRRVIAEWLATGSAPGPKLRSARIVRDGITVTDLVAAYWKHRKAQAAVQRGIDGTDKPALRRFRALYGYMHPDACEPRSIRAFQLHLVTEAGLSRQYVNSKVVPVIKRMFRWGAQERLVSAETAMTIASVEGLRYGQFAARETQPVTAVPDDLIEATLPHLPPVVADMVRVQRLTGMRPGEVCGMTWAEIDTSGECWVYRPSKHKNAHRGKRREVALGPKSQAVLIKYFGREPSAAVFSPKRPKAPLKEALAPSRTKGRSRRPGDWYNTGSYCVAITRAAARAGVARWTPNQLRHAAATALRSQVGLDAAWSVLGHDKPDTTLIYAERRLEDAKSLAVRYG